MFRFSLQTLFGAMFLAAIVLATLFALPLWAGCWVLLVSTVVLGAAAGAGGWYAREGTRTFCAAVFLTGGCALWVGQPFPPAGLIYQPVHAAFDQSGYWTNEPIFWSGPVWRFGKPDEWITLDQQVVPSERVYQFLLLSIWGLALLAGVSACVVRACCLRGAQRIKKHQEPASQPALSSP